MNNNFIPDPKQSELSDKIVVTKGETITEKDFLINFLELHSSLVARRLKKKKVKVDTGLN